MKQEKVDQDEEEKEIMQLKGTGRCALGLGGTKQRETTVPLHVCEGALPVAARCK